MTEYILVTGGMGFIGSHTVCEIVKNGHHCIIVDTLENSSQKCLERINQITGKPENVQYFGIDYGDVQAMSEQIFEKFKIVSVIHFAGYKAVGESGAKPLSYYNNNVAKTVYFLQMMEKYDVNNIIFSSSACVYGVNGQVNEGSQLGPINPYGRTKLMIEQILEDAAHANKKLSAIALRYFNPIGADPSGLIGESPKDIPNNLMPYIMRVGNKIAPFLGIFGNDYDTHDGTGVRDFIHVVDLAKGHSAALNKQKELQGFNVYNLGTGRGTSVLELVAAFEKANDIKIPFEIQGRRPGDAATSMATVDKANEVLGWKTELTIEEACRDAWNYASKNPNGYESPADQQWYVYFHCDDKVEYKQCESQEEAKWKFEELDGWMSKLIWNNGKEIERHGDDHWVDICKNEAISNDSKK